MEVDPWNVPAVFLYVQVFQFQRGHVQQRCLGFSKLQTHHRNELQQDYRKGSDGQGPYHVTVHSEGKG